MISLVGFMLRLHQLPVTNPFCSLAVAVVQGAPNEVVKPSDGRASLLESIRQAGGIGKANLRSVKEKKLEKKKMKEQEQGWCCIQSDSYFLGAQLSSRREIRGVECNWQAGTSRVPNTAWAYTWLLGFGRRSLSVCVCQSLITLVGP